MKYQGLKFISISFSIATIVFLFGFKNEKNNSQITDNQGIAVLQLFTSEGCSSCPPADDILRKYANQDNIFALSYHVTYWNRLGWADLFSQKQFDNLQYSYGENFRLSSVYTPQIVVNGNSEAVGSSENKIANIVNTALAKAAKNTILLEKSIKNNEITFKFNIKGDISKNAILNFELIESNLSTKVKRGENEGKTLLHDNVVRSEKTLKATEKGEITFEIDPTWKKENCAIIVFIQDSNLGQINGASKLVF